MQRRSFISGSASGLAFAPALLAGAQAAGATPAAPPTASAGDTPSLQGIPGAYARSSRHTSFYLELGLSSGPAIVFIHGWPEIGLAWRHQLRSLATLGWRVVAPDLRGCGRSSPYREHAAYAQREIVQDMIELADRLGIERAVWVGHDWGASVAWNVASHHPERCHGVAALCVPYDTLERGLDRLAGLVDRELYPKAEYPAGQYEYIAFYRERFDEVRQVFDGNVENLLKVILRRGDPAQAGKPFATANVRRQGGWFGPGRPPPAVPLDRAVLDDATLAAYVEAYTRTGFFGVNSLYMNDADNVAYADAAPGGGVLNLPALFVSGRYDYVNDTVRSGLTEPMQAKCRRLTMRSLPCGHWMQNERPTDVNAVLAQWLGVQLAQVWPAQAA